MPVATAAGISPMAAANDVIKTGRMRTSALFMIAVRMSNPSSRRSRMRDTRMRAPCTATPKSEMKPTAAEMLKCVRVSARARTPPTRGERHGDEDQQRIGAWN